MRAAWTVWSTATSEQSARNVAKRFMRRLACEPVELLFAPYPKTHRWTFTFQTHLTSVRWNDQVVEAIGLGQRVGYN